MLDLIKAPGTGNWPFNVRLIRAAFLYILAATTIFLILPGCSGSSGEPHDLPNIILVMADDIGIEGFGCYGGTSYETPNLDRMAGEGLRFTHAYSQPLCTPTRIQLMTGRYNHRNWLYFGILPPEEKTIGHLMSDAGYRTCIAGKWQLYSYDPPGFAGAEERRGTGMHPRDAGFETYSLFHSLHTEDKGSRYANPTYLRNGELIRDVEGKYGEDLNLGFIIEFLKVHRDEPLFVYYPMALPHWPVVPTPISDVWDDPSRRLENDLRYFPDMVKYMDILMGRLVEAVKNLELAEKTLILFYSDNGTDKKVISRMGDLEIPGGKGWPGQNGIRVPLIAWWPGTVEPGISHELVDASDFLPTLASLAGTEIPGDWYHDGKSFAHQLFGEEGKNRDHAFFWYDPRPGWDKSQFRRWIFALDHEFKLYSDGRMFDISGLTPTEMELDTANLTFSEKTARDKLENVIREMMKPPMSASAMIDPGKHEMESNQ
jgi:arylsulfatase A-like enzyme